MRRNLTLRLAQLVLLVGPLFAVAGCPIDATDGAVAASLAGTYWVEYRAGALEAYVLPEFRDDEGLWLTLDTEVPDWYTGPALYELSDDGTWARLTDGDLTLDDVLQVYDPPPGPAAAQPAP